MPSFSPVILRGFPSRVNRVDDLVYASRNGRDLHADLYLPHGDDAPGPVPVIVWLHAGGWIAGNRRRAPDLARHFAERGFAMISIDYRLSREAIFPAALEDVISAIAWVRGVSKTWNLDPERIGVWGASAGGHLAALAALSAPDTRVKAVASIYPPVDFLAMPPSVKDYESRFLGAPVAAVPDLVRKANPAAFAHAGAPPFLLVHGTADQEVPPTQSEILYDALRAENNFVTLSLIDGLEHGFLETVFDQTRPQRVRTSAPNEPEYSADAPPFTWGTIETFFKRFL